MSGDHVHEHDHGEKDPREIRAEALEHLLTEQGLVSAEAIDAILRHYEQDVGPMNGARAVARAWVDPAYRERLLENGTAAIAELGLGGPQGERLVVVENTPSVHNVVVCTLCSCYPWPVLGLPPAWYKDPAYRSRVVREPRRVLSEFGLELPGRGGGARLGLERRDPLPGAARTAARNRSRERGSPRGPGEPGRHDRRGQGGGVSARERMLPTEGPPRRRAPTASSSSQRRGRAGSSASPWRSSRRAASSGPSSRSG